MWVIVSWMDNGDRGIDVCHTEEDAKKEYEETKQFFRDSNVGATVRLMKVLESEKIESSWD